MHDEELFTFNFAPWPEYTSGGDAEVVHESVVSRVQRHHGCAVIGESLYWGVGQCGGANKCAKRIGV